MCVCVSVCVCMHVCVYVCVRMCACVYVCVHVCVYSYVCARVHLCVPACVCVTTHACVCAARGSSVMDLNGPDGVKLSGRRVQRYCVSAGKCPAVSPAHYTSLWESNIRVSSAPVLCSK